MDTDDSDNNSVDELLTDSMRTPEASKLINKPQSEEKLSGKAWGRVKNVFTRRGRYPSSIFFIIGNEFCERFSYYGMKTILVIYLTQRLGFHNDPATAVYHGFSMLCYFMPLFGAILADGFLGKFRTILYVSIVYALGNIVMALTALPPPYWVGPMVGLLLIGIGTGGIKPCVSAFGGDQFAPDQTKEIQSFFSVFYFAINAGSVISTFLTPILRADVQCFGADCYPLAFGIPAFLMIVSLIIFVAGRHMYKVNPPTGNLIGKVCRCVVYGVKKKLISADKTEHWLDHSVEKFEQGFVEDVKCLLKVLFLFLPLPIFWALFDQQGSRWTLQAEKMNGDLGALGQIKPDQMQVINPILILVLIPVFENIVYPLLDRCHIPNRPLQRMVAGMVLAVIAFIVAGFMQMKIDNSLEAPLGSSETGFTVINSLKLPLTVKSSELEFDKTLDQYQSSAYTRHTAGNFTFDVETTNGPSKKSTKFNMEPQKAYRLIAVLESGQLLLNEFPDPRQKPAKGNSSVSILCSLGNVLTPEVVCLKSEDVDARINVTHTIATDFVSLAPGRYTLFLPFNKTDWLDTGQLIVLESGAVYTVVLSPSAANTEQVVAHTYINMGPSTVSMAYQVPQYIIITTAEILFSITGLSFSYSQAPATMKSVLQASWLMTIAVGNMIVLIVAEVNVLPSQSAEFFLFASLMGADVILFTIMATFYKYTNQMIPEEEEMDDRTGLVNTDQSESLSVHEKEK